jgi:hypothetical protein
MISVIRLATGFRISGMVEDAERRDRLLDRPLRGAGFPNVGLELGEVGEIAQDGAEHGADHLTKQIDPDLVPLSGVDGDADRDGRIELPTGQGSGGVRARQHAEPPAERDHHPSRRPRLRVSEGDGGADTRAEKNQNRGADDLPDEYVSIAHGGS